MADRQMDKPVAVYAVIPAAGSGSRMNLNKNKQFLQLGRYPVIVRTLLVLESMPEIAGYVAVAAADELAAMQELLIPYKLAKCLSVAAGGASRQDSVANGLAALEKLAGGLPGCPVLVHDGARCFITPDVIRRVICGILQHGACGAAVAVKDTIKQADADGQVTCTFNRDQLWAMQTPQGAWFPLLQKAYELASRNNWQATDDLALLEKSGTPVYLVPGDYRNIKLTTPEDRLLGEQLARLADQGRLL